MPLQTHGSVGGILVNGYDLSPFCNQLSENDTVEAVNETCFGPLGTPVTANAYIAGLEDATAQADGKYVIDHAAGAPNQDQIADVLEAAIRATAKPIVSFFPWGDGFGNNVGSYIADETSYDVSSSISSIITVSAKFQASGGASAGQVIHALASEAAGSNVPGTDLDAGVGYDATKWKGLNATLHVLDVSGAGPSLTAKVQHSVDGVTWADLVAFSAITAKHKAARVQFLGTVNRHVRAMWTVAAGTTATFHLSAGRIPA